MSLTLDILTTKYIKLITKNQLFLLLFFLSPQTVLFKLFQKTAKNNRFIFIEKIKKKC
jgi:hypothetical protein